VWLEDAAGNLGVPATAQLRFDGTRPGGVEPLPTSGWIGGPDFPYPVRLGPPAGPPPPSGVRGYAVAVDRDPNGSPCASADRCNESEADLLGGPEENTLWLAPLPEGISYVHAVAVSGSGMRSASVGHASLRVDTTAPATTMTGIPSGWANRPVTLRAQASDAASGMLSEGGAAGPFTAIRIDGGAPISASGDAVQARVIDAGTHTIAHYACDAAGNTGDGHGANPEPATATVRIDPDPPRVAFSGVQDPSDPEIIEARVLDSLSGPSLARGQIAVRRAGSGERFEVLPTTVGEGWLRARWDSQAYPPGEFEFEATGFDRAGNRASTQLRADGSRMALSAPLKAATKLNLRIDPQGSIALGAGARLEGRLIGGRRSPLSGMTIKVVERFEPGPAKEHERVSAVRTAGHGDFTLRLAPGPSREVVASFAGTATLARTQSDSVKLSVRTRVQMRASAAVATVGGPPIVFSGRVAGAIPAAGKYVQLQFRLPGLTWSEFRTVRTDSRGRFRYAYRFSDDDSRGVRFQFRAYAPAQGDWPYEPGGSEPVAVRGR